MEIRKNCAGCNFAGIEEYQICDKPISIEKIKPDSVRVTNKDYGSCLETVRCPECGLIQPKYELSFKEVVKLYSNMDDEEYIRSSYLRGLSNYEQIMKILRKYFDKPASILEIGSGSGSLVSLLRNYFPNVEGIEPSKYFCDYAKEKYNVDIKNISFEALDTEKKYDVVLALDVIEHVASPDDFMCLIGNLLNVGGIAIIVTPNKKSISAKIMGKKWWHIRPPHLFYFDDKSFDVISKKHDLNLISKKFFSWNLPFYYLLDSVQKLLFGKAILRFDFLNFNIKVNLFDSRLYVLKK